ncbi:MAG: 3-deoxy-8-phosphooctulonate synthase [Puniceicoccales bacterium]|jgi:2-dehydro-3-deoxyphosphooctonate aldolase (KDO 8-P synthase)|nr:3-deoxy-8-phosphooctulonate synthase [Puniceicoccales bacterium]
MDRVESSLLRRDPQKLLLLAGPCSLESWEISSTVAAFLAGLLREYPDLQIVFKGSFDKANRSSLHSARGVGLQRGLEILREVKGRYALPVTSDFHVPEQAEALAEVCEVLQVPAFLCRQTDMLVAAARTGRTVSVKKGQFLSPKEMRHVIEKLQGSGAREIWPMERGASFGYQNLVVDMRSFAIMRAFASTVLFDATHSVQIPGGSAGVTQGERFFTPLLARAALAAGANGLFFEVHPRPAQATCDAANQCPMEDFEGILQQCLATWRLCRTWAEKETTA